MTPTTALAVLRATVAQSEALEQLAGEILATLRLNLDRGTLRDDPKASPTLSEVVTRWERRLNLIRGPQPTKEFTAEVQGTPPNPPVCTDPLGDVRDAHVWNDMTNGCVNCGLKKANYFKR